MKIEEIGLLIKLLRPKYYNRITKLLVVGGLALLSKPIWVDFLNLVLGEFKLSLIGEFDWALGLIVIILALLYNLYHRYLDLKHETKNEPAFNKVIYKKFTEFGKLAQAIFPLLKDNEYMFKNTAPNSGSSIVEPLRTDFTLWEKLKREAILPNNESIKKLLQENKSLFPNKYEAIINKMFLHIDAFNEHVINPNFDYSQYQFPIEFSDIIFAESFKVTLLDKKLIKMRKWLEKKLISSLVIDWFIFGSAVFISDKANDIDIAVISNANNLYINNYINQLKFDFKIKFKKDLHITLFEEVNKNDYQIFLNKNPFHIK